MKIILGLAGEIASGKGTAAKYIVKKYKGSSHRFSEMLRDVAKRMHLEEDRNNLQKISTMLRKYFGEDVLSKNIYLDVQKDKHKILTIDGVRRLDDIKYLKKLPGFKLVYLEADMQSRYERILKRRENMDEGVKSFAKFKNDNSREAEKKIKGLKKKADYFIENAGTLQNFYEKLDEIINSVTKDNK